VKANKKIDWQNLDTPFPHPEGKKRKEKTLLSL
jgi:hypothetical protein